MVGQSESEVEQPFRPDGSVADKTTAVGSELACVLAIFRKGRLVRRVQRQSKNVESKVSYAVRVSGNGFSGSLWVDLDTFTRQRPIAV
jgi:hypothetical protein